MTVRRQKELLSLRFFAFVLFCFLPDSHLEEVSPQEEKAAQHLPPLNKAKNSPNKEKRGALSLKSRDSFRIFEHLFILTLYFSQCFQFSCNDLFSLFCSTDYCKQSSPPIDRHLKFWGPLIIVEMAKQPASFGRLCRYQPMDNKLPVGRIGHRRYLIN